MASVHLLAVVGEVSDEGQKGTLERDLLVGLKSWQNSGGFDLNSELQKIPESNPELLDVDGCKYFTHSTEKLKAAILLQPSIAALKSIVSSLLHDNSGDDKIIVYTGLIADGSAQWYLRDGLFTPEALLHLISGKKPHQNGDVGSPVSNGTGKQAARLHLACAAVPSGGDWRHHLVDKLSTTTTAHAISINSGGPASTREGEDCSGLERFAAMVTSRVSPPPPGTLFPAAAGRGIVRVERPSLYIFPEGQGESSMFLVNGFSLLINAGYGLSPQFWAWLRHSDRLDGVLVTHWSPDNLLGLRGLIDRDKSDGPHVGCVLLPPPTKVQAAAGDDGNSLVLNLPREVSRIISSIKSLNINVTELTRGAKMGVSAKVVPLFHKAGYGSLDLYPLTPADDEVELKKLMEEWAKAAPVLTPIPLGKTPPASKHTVPMLNYLGMTALLVWRPAHPNQPITRILYTGLAHQARVLAALDAMLGAHPFLRASKFVPAEADKPAKKPAAAAAAGPAPKKPASTPRPTSSVSTTSAPATKPDKPAASNKPAHTRPSAPSAGPIKKPNTESGSGPTTSTATTNGGSNNPHKRDPVHNKKPAAATPAPHTKPTPAASKPAPPPPDPVETVLPEVHPVAASQDPPPAANAPDNGEPSVEVNGEAAQELPAPDNDEPLVEVNGGAARELPAPDNDEPLVEVNGGEAPPATLIDEDLGTFDSEHTVHAPETVEAWGAPNGLPLPPSDAEPTSEQPAPPQAAASHAPAHAQNKPAAGTKPDKKPATDPKKLGATAHAAPGKETKKPAPSGRPSTAPAQKPTPHSGGKAGPAADHHAASGSAKAASKPAGTAAPAAGAAPTPRPSTIALAPGATDASAHAGGPNKPPYDKVRPVYVDLAFVPSHGSSRGVDVEWFKRVRAHQYVVTTLDPDVHLLDSLLIAKETWEGDDARQKVSLIPTYDTPAMLNWLHAHKDRLDAAEIEIGSSAAKCSVELHNRESVCAAYRAEF